MNIIGFIKDKSQNYSALLKNAVQMIGFETHSNIGETQKSVSLPLIDCSETKRSQLQFVVLKISVWKIH